MNIFVAGVHGVGKTYLASRAAPEAGMLHTSASELIKEERALTTWTNDKRVTDVEANQRALTAAVRRCNRVGTSLLLDGHFVLEDSEGKMIRLAVDVFAALNLTGVLLVEGDPQAVACRIEERDGRRVLAEHLKVFMEAERDQAQQVSAELQIPRIVLNSPSPEEFAAALAAVRPRVN